MAIDLHPYVIIPSKLLTLLQEDVDDHHNDNRGTGPKPRVLTGPDTKYRCCIIYYLVSCKWHPYFLRSLFCHFRPRISGNCIAEIHFSAISFCPGQTWSSARTLPSKRPDRCLNDIIYYYLWPPEYHMTSLHSYIII